MPEYAASEVGALLNEGLNYTEQMGAEGIPVTHISVLPSRPSHNTEDIRLLLNVTAHPDALHEQSRLAVDRTLRLASANPEVRGARQFRGNSMYLGQVSLREGVLLEVAAEQDDFRDPVPSPQLLNMGRLLAYAISHLTLPVRRASMRLRTVERNAEMHEMVRGGATMHAVTDAQRLEAMRIAYNTLPDMPRRTTGDEYGSTTRFIFDDHSMWTFSTDFK